MCLKTLLYTKLFGKLVGTDDLGNKYYESHQKRWFGKKNRWVVYGRDNKLVANIDTVWYKWLHYMSDEIPMKLKKSHNWMVDSGVTEYDKVTCKKSQVVFDGQYSIWNHKSNK